MMLIVVTMLLGVGFLFTSSVYAQQGNFKAAKGNPNFRTALEDAVTTNHAWSNFIDKAQWWVKNFLQKFAADPQGGAQSLSDFIVKVIEALIPLLAMVGIILALIGFYKIMISEDAAELKKGWNFILWWIVGTLIMVAAAWIVTQLVGANWILTGIENGGADFNAGQFVADLYQKIVYPLLKVVLSLIIWIMFLMAVASAFKYLFSGDEEASKKALQILVFTVLGILVIILAKTMVESVFGSYQSVVDGNTDLGWVGTGVFENADRKMLYTILNWLMGLLTFLLTTIIIYIGYLILVQPTDEETTGKLKKAVTRWLVGILLMGAAYLLANFVLVK